MVDRKHSLPILGNLITAGTSPIVYLHGVRVRERGGGRERERGGGRGRGRGKETERVGEKEGGRDTDKKNTSKVLATSQLQVYARVFQLVVSPA